MKKKDIETKYSIDRQAEIYEKALGLFIDQGYDGTSMSMIANTLGMSKPNLYYYCPSKEDLLYRIHLNDLEKRFIPIIESTEKILDPKDRIAHFLRKFTLMCTSSPSSRVLVHEVRKLTKKHQKEIVSIWTRAYALVSNAFRELQDSGRLPKSSRDSFLTFIWTGMTLWTVYWFDYSRQENAEELAELIATTFERSLDEKSCR